MAMATKSVMVWRLVPGSPIEILRYFLEEFADLIFKIRE
jgi:hypothetical protein